MRINIADDGGGTMIRLIRSTVVSATGATFLVVTSLFGEETGKQQQLQSPSLATNRVVVSTVALSQAQQPASNNGAAQPQGGAAEPGALRSFSAVETQKIADLYKRVRQTLSLGRPQGLAKYMADLSAKTKYKLGHTALAERILAKGIAARQVARNVHTLTISDVNTAVDNLTEQEIAEIFKEQTRSLTGLKAPDKDALQKHIDEQNKKAAEIVGPLPRKMALGLAATGAPTPNMPAFNWTQRGIVTAVQDQRLGAVCSPGCCWAFATVGVFEAAYAKANGILVGASEQYLLGCAQSPLQALSTLFPFPEDWDCRGGWWAFPMLTKAEVPGAGLPRRSDLPYSGLPTDPNCNIQIDRPYLIKSWAYVGNNAGIPSNDDLKKALCANGPLAVAIFGDPNWIHNLGDVIDDLPSDPANPSVNHAVVLIGWDDRQNNGNGAWMIKNSWGDGYGIQNSGFLYIGYNCQNIGYSAAYVVVK
jgi:hypothetical protein